jgi:hypothetical protein
MTLPVSGKQVGRPGSLVIVRHSTATAFLQWQPGLCALQGLHLALLVHTKHHRLVGGVQIETHHISELFEAGSGRRGAPANSSTGSGRSSNKLRSKADRQETEIREAAARELRDSKRTGIRLGRPEAGLDASEDFGESSRVETERKYLLNQDKV